MRKAVLAIIFVCVAGIINSYSFGFGATLMQGAGDLLGEPEYGGVIFSPMEKLHVTVVLPLGGTIGIGGTADFHFMSKPVMELKKDGSLNFYVGVGGNFMAMFGDETSIGAKARVPIGISWKYSKFDIFLQTVPGVSFMFGTNTEIGPAIVPFEIGFRYWL
jgi:hypothetical protein